ncbi:MAG: uracil phosphoribosyltransferase [Flavobacteriaceae bacterium]
MSYINLSDQNSILNTFLSEIRDASIQKDAMRFRRNLERMGEIFAYEISKQLNYTTTEVTTPLGVSKINLPTNDVVLTTIMRAGLPFHQGFLNYFDKAENGFIGAFRATQKDHSFDIEADYFTCPSIDHKTVILSDPMLASGASILTALDILKTRGNAKHIHIAALIGSQQGVNHVLKHLPDNVTLWLGAVDSVLNNHAYIVPGLGDAGDLAFGEKL